MRFSLFISEIVISVILVALAVLFLDPFMIVMPASVLSALIAALFILFLLFAGFVWKERAIDERDEFHQLRAGRIAYLVGVAILVCGIITEAFTLHAVDQWLILALSGMVLAKLAGRMYDSIQR